MKTALLIAFLALGAAGCKSSSHDSGAPASGYETSSGKGQSTGTNITTSTTTTTTTTGNPSSPSGQ